MIIIIKSKTKVYIIKIIMILITVMNKFLNNGNYKDKDRALISYQTVIALVNGSMIVITAIIV